MPKMILYGSTPLAGNTRPSRHTKRNSLAQSNPLWSTLCGGLGLPPKSSSSLGWLFKTEFGRQTLEKRGWPNCGLCTLCKQKQESVDHLFYKCRFSIRLWGLVKDWLQLVSIDTSSWHLSGNIEEWWVGLSDTSISNRKAMASLTMLVAWTIWNERNARVFHQKSAPPTVLLANIKKEATLWVSAGASKLGYLMTRE
uniref:Reverse transcriptase zinc-binding domain-containing protein n=1 Tax=Triticum urartu TaxID=4572 RepID=A0A8R7P3V4_TRIUA